MQGSSYFVSTAKIIFVTNCIIAQEKVIDIFKLLQSIGSINNLLILDEPEPKLFVYDTFKNQEKITNVSVSTTNALALFPDKLKDMHRYQYNVLLLTQPPRILMNEDGTDFYGVDVEVMNIIAASQNAGMKMKLGTGFDTLEKIKLFRDVLHNQLIDLTLNTIFTVKTSAHRKVINTYDQNSYCAIIPIPPPLTFLHFLFTPFDGLTWTFIIASVVACAFVWYILNCLWGETDSALYFIFGMIAVFLGQGVPFKPHHKWQKILIQLCMLMMFIMGNLYQSFIISSMSWSRDGIRLKTFEELFDSGADMFVTRKFYDIFNKSNEFDEALSRMEAVQSLAVKDLIDSKKPMIGRCDTLEFMTKVDVKFDLGSHFYMLPDSMMPFYEKFVLARNSPFYEKLQTMHNFVFESGIRQYWKYLLEQENSAELNRNDLYFIREKYLLSLDDLYGLFYLLFGGWWISVFTFSVELVWSYLRHNVDYWKITKRVRKVFMTKNRAMQIRRTRVHPMEV